MAKKVYNLYFPALQLDLGPLQGPDGTNHWLVGVCLQELKIGTFHRRTIVLIPFQSEAAGPTGSPSPGP